MEETWSSPRVDIAIDAVERQRDIEQDSVFLIVDESVFFLDILAIGLTDESRLIPIPIFRYDGRLDSAERAQSLEQFTNARGCRILLASRAAVVRGLNIQSANVLIRCGPWENSSWEELAVGRIHRYGQTRRTWVYELRAMGALVEDSRVKARDEKSALNKRIMAVFTRLDNAQPPHWEI